MKFEAQGAADIAWEGQMPAGEPMDEAVKAVGF
jgi:hypothetical protein